MERARSRAAHVQDAAVGQILAGLKAKRFTRKQLKERTGWGSERLSRYMTGQVPIQLDDLMLLLDAAGSRSRRSRGCRRRSSSGSVSG